MRAMTASLSDAGSIELSRNRSIPSMSRMFPINSGSILRRSGEIESVVADVHPGEHDLDVAGADEPSHLAEHARRGAAP